MGTTKSNHFSNSQNELANIAKALGHPARIAIVEHFLQKGTCICGDLVQNLPLAQPTISQHLKVLKQADIIQGSIEGNSLCYCLNPRALDIIFKFIANSLENINLNKTRN